MRQNETQISPIKGKIKRKEKNNIVWLNGIYNNGKKINAYYDKNRYGMVEDAEKFDVLQQVKLKKENKKMKERWDRQAKLLKIREERKKKMEIEKEKRIQKQIMVNEILSDLTGSGYKMKLIDDFIKEFGKEELDSAIKKKQIELEMKKKLEQSKFVKNFDNTGFQNPINRVFNKRYDNKDVNNSIEVELPKINKFGAIYNSK